MTKGVATGSLRGNIGPLQLFALGFGPIVGSAWVVILGQWLGSGGPGGAIIGFMAGGLIMVCIAACYAELTARTPMTGGEFTFTREVYGRLPAFVVGWFMMLCWVCVTVFEGLALAWFAELLVPALKQVPLYSLFGADVSATHLIIGSVGALCVAAVNFAGSKAIVRFQSIFTYGFLAVAILILGDMLMHGRTVNLAPMFPNDGEINWWVGAIGILASAGFLFNGFQTVSQVIEERSPHISFRTVGWVMLSVIVAASAFYCLSIIASSVTVPWRELISTELPVVEAVRRLPAGAILAPVLIVATMASLIKTWNSVFLVGVRTLIALGREGMVPPAFAMIDAKSGTPRAAVFLMAVLNIAGLFLGRGAIGSLVDMSAASMTLCYALCCFAVLILRGRLGPATGFQVPGGVLTIAVAILGSCLMMGSALIQPLFKAQGLPLLHCLLFTWLTLGAVFWLAYGGRQSEPGQPL